MLKQIMLTLKYVESMEVL